HDAAAQLPPARLAEPPQALAVELDDAVRHLGVRREEVHDRLRDRALAGSGFAHDRDNLAAAHRQAHAPHGVDLAVADLVDDPQALDAQDHVVLVASRDGVVVVHRGVLLVERAGGVVPFTLGRRILAVNRCFGMELCMPRIDQASSPAPSSPAPSSPAPSSPAPSSMRARISSTSGFCVSVLHARSSSTWLTRPEGSLGLTGSSATVSGAMRLADSGTSVKPSPALTSASSVGTCPAYCAMRGCTPLATNIDRSRSWK